MDKIHVFFFLNRFTVSISYLFTLLYTIPNTSIMYTKPISIYSAPQTYYLLHLNLINH